jgi:4-hydroxybenzoate polyprenyltransferase/phosphoglycolate phosphatase-like HAD superfamily hydrolase
VSKSYKTHAVLPGSTDTAFPALPLGMPLVLDLDGTLIRGDLLFESFVAAVKKNPLMALLSIWWLVSGGAARLKERLAGVALADTDLIPVNAEIAALAERESRAGRPVVLATAADRLLAARIAKRFAFLDRVIASNGIDNLKGAAKAQVLAEAYPQGFLYAGDSRADLAVWRKAKAAIAVEAPASVLAALERSGIPFTVFGVEPSYTRAILKGARIQQWVKNALVFLPIPLAGRLFDLAAWGHAVLAFAAIGFLASATYLINDLCDLAEDRRHHSKKRRPLASGAMPIAMALRLIPPLVVLGFSLALLVGWGVAATLLAYGVATLSYSLSLKRVPLLDTALIAGLFSLRLLLGVVAVGAMLSPWLFVFSMTVFLSMALAKRHTELARMKLASKAVVNGRGYRGEDEAVVLAMGAAASTVSVFVLCLYLMDDAARAAHYGAPQFLWLAPVAIFLWLGRIWILSQRGELDDDPVAFAVKDRVSLGLAAVTLLAFVLAFSLKLPLAS